MKILFLISRKPWVKPPAAGIVHMKETWHGKTGGAGLAFFCPSG